jgi:membrane-associated phospholipid phosphatase
MPKAWMVVSRYVAGWPEWCGALTPVRRWSPLVFVACYWSAVKLLGGFRGDHFSVGLIVLALGYGGPLAATLLRFLLPLIITGIAYDSRRYLNRHLLGPVHVAEPYLLEKRLFGIPTTGGVLTPSEWWQRHLHPVLDLATGLCYISFIATFVLTAAYFVFRVSRTGTKTRSAAFVRQRAPRMMWSLLVLNLAVFVTSAVYPAAPPWYVARYGLGPADLAAAPSPAGCVRFDQLLGTQVFSAFYGRSVDVFGAIASLHVAYPFLALYYAVQFRAVRAICAAVFVMMCFSAVYLNHHYVVDLVVGSAYALLVGMGMDLLDRTRVHGGRLACVSAAA